ncbi:hypothetical protein C1H76_4728 [Elsinoe australis]|uniref:Uncharacterized protein n=1 Tax=Elsinoe australis TaxID=40998 RepID=A0A4U7B2S6_9PEZI|nr:hypothetical protein C1H76_4728 [Elsinoe australis]
MVNGPTDAFISKLSSAFICIDLDTAHEQHQSLFFSSLPPEVRQLILEAVLGTCYDSRKRYNRDSIWRRPDQEAPLTSYTDVLNTCKRIYAEGRLLLWQSSDLVFYFVPPPERPPRCTNPFRLEQRLKALQSEGLYPTIRSVQIFCHLTSLQTFSCLQDVLDLENLNPRTVITTIRHTDFPGWKTDEPLSISGTWVSRCILPTSVNKFVLEIESLKRKAAQVNYLTKAALQTWFFRRTDGSVLTADVSDVTVSEWQGRSTLNDRRWIRDESLPNELHYHITKLIFRPRSWGCALAHAQEQIPDLTVPSCLITRLSSNGASVRVADHQFRRMLIRHSKTFSTPPLHGSTHSWCPGSWPEEKFDRADDAEEMDPSWLFPKLDWLLSEPEDTRFGGRQTGYYHMSRRQS